LVTLAVNVEDNAVDVFKMEMPLEEAIKCFASAYEVPVKSEHNDEWLDPDPSNLAAQYAILDDRNRPYYDYRKAA
jgi:hypothetical protein